MDLNDMPFNGEGGTTEDLGYFGRYGEWIEVSVRESAAPSGVATSPARATPVATSGERE